MRRSGSMAKCRAGAAIPARLPFRASTCPIAWCLEPKSRPATDPSSQCLRLTDQCLIRSEAFGFAKPWWSFIVDEREARQGGLRAVQRGQEIMRRVAIWVRAIPRPARSATSHHPDSLSAGAPPEDPGGAPAPPEKGGGIPHAPFRARPPSPTRAPRFARASFLL